MDSIRESESLDPGSTPGGIAIRAADVTGNRTGLKSRVSEFESRAEHHGGIALAVGNIDASGVFL